MNAPDWLINEIDPGSGLRGPNVAFRPTPVFMIPSEFGPTRFRSCSSAILISSPSRVDPSLPASLNPAVITTTFSTPASAASRTTPTAIPAGTATTAASIPSTPVTLS